VSDSKAPQNLIEQYRRLELQARKSEAEAKAFADRFARDEAANELRRLGVDPDQIQAGPERKPQEQEAPRRGIPAALDAMISDLISRRKPVARDLSDEALADLPGKKGR